MPSKWGFKSPPYIFIPHCHHQCSLNWMVELIWGRTNLQNKSCQSFDSCVIGAHLHREHTYFFAFRNFFFCFNFFFKCKVNHKGEAITKLRACTHFNNAPVKVSLLSFFFGTLFSPHPPPSFFLIYYFNLFLYFYIFKYLINF